MRKITAFILLLFVISCSSPATPYLTMGMQLSRAGFVAHLANTTARYAMMNSLPPGYITYRPSSMGKVFLYSDPIGCGCVYMGSQRNLDNFIKMRVAEEQERANREKEVMGKISLPQIDEMSAENRRDTALWDWSAWSPNADPGGNQPRHVSGAYW